MRKIKAYALLLSLVAYSSSAQTPTFVSPISGKTYNELIKEALKLGANKQDLMILCRGNQRCTKEIPSG